MALASVHHPYKGLFSEAFFTCACTAVEPISGLV